MNKFYCRTAPSLGGGFEGTPESAWGVETYNPKTDRDKPTVFFGLYDIRDYLAIWNHKGKKWILWCGSDINSLLERFLFGAGRFKWISKVFPKIPQKFLNYLRFYCDNYVEDKDEQEKLLKLDISSRIVPSFLGKIEDFPITYKQSDRPNVYLSAHEGREKEYGFDLIKRIAKRVPKCIFHFYGTEYLPRISSTLLTGRYLGAETPENIISHGWIPLKQFNEETKNFQCGLRLNKSDGFSEITAKSVLWGQYPITYLEYPNIANFKTEDELVALLKGLKDMEQPNVIARQYYIFSLNRYPFNTKL